MTASALPIDALIQLLEHDLPAEERNAALRQVAAHPEGTIFLRRTAALLNLLADVNPHAWDRWSGPNADLIAYSESVATLTTEQRERIERLLTVSSEWRRRLAWVRQTVEEAPPETIPAGAWERARARLAALRTPKDVGPTPVPLAQHVIRCGIRWIQDTVEMAVTSLSAAELVPVPVRSAAEAQASGMRFAAGSLEIVLLALRQPDGQWRVTAHAVERESRRPAEGRFLLRTDEGALRAAGELSGGSAQFTSPSDGAYRLTLVTDSDETELQIQLRTGAELDPQR